MKLDLGCGKNKQAGFHGVDSIAFDGVDTVHDLRIAPWPWEDGSIEEVFTSHFLEHLDQQERVTFFNELHRVLAPGAKATIICPHWSHERAYGDPTHKWPAMTGFAFNYLLEAWRESQAPHTDIKYNPLGYSCDFDFVVGGGWDPNDVWVSLVNQEAKMVRMTRNINCCTDLHATITKRA